MAIFKKRGKWWIGYRASGKRHREPIGESYTLAKEVLAKRTAQAAERKHFPARVANASTFEKVAEKFWDLHGKHLLSPSWAAMLGIVRRKFSGRKMAEIGTAEIQGFYNEIAARTSSSTANRYLTQVRSIFNKAKAWGDFYGDNPCTFVKKQRERGHRLRFLATDEIKSLYAVALPSLYPVLVAALHTGMRQGEILGLRWENVALDRSTIYILQSKSGKPREIPMTNKLHEVLTALGPRPEGLVFDMPLITLRRYFAKALKAAAISGFRFHDLRHTFASHFIMRTNDLTTLQRLLGHSTPAMTMRYAHLSRGHVQSAMAVFEATMPEKSPILTLAGHQEGHHLYSATAC